MQEYSAIGEQRKEIRASDNVGAYFYYVLVPHPQMFVAILNVRHDVTKGGMM